MTGKRQVSTLIVTKLISIKYFASLRDTLGKADEQLDAADPGTVLGVWNSLNPDMPLPENTLAAINQVYCPLDAPVQQGDEVAFFPPVTGG